MGEPFENFLGESMDAARASRKAYAALSRRLSGLGDSGSMAAATLGAVAHLPPESAVKLLAVFVSALTLDASLPDPSRVDSESLIDEHLATIKAFLTEAAVHAKFMGST